MPKQFKFANSEYMNSCGFPGQGLARIAGRVPEGAGGCRGMVWGVGIRIAVTETT
jgi:hypothetical protein